MPKPVTFPPVTLTTVPGGRPDADRLIGAAMTRSFARGTPLRLKCQLSYLVPDGKGFYTAWPAQLWRLEFGDEALLRKFRDDLAVFVTEWTGEHEAATED